MSLFALFGIVVTVTSLSLLGSLAGWYYCLETYEEELGERAFKVLKFVLPPFLFLSASPLFDVVLWQLGFSFPTIGAPGLVLGLLGAAITLGFVVYDIRSPDPDAGGEVDAEVG